MSSELEALFDGITSNDQNVINIVTERINEQMNNPQFIFFLFQSLTNELLQNNPTIYMLVQITIFNNIRQKWTAEFTEETPVFWSPEIQESIVFTLIEAVFSIPSLQRKHFIGPIKYIIQHNFPFVGNIILKLNDMYSRNPTNIDDTNTYLEIVICYSKTTKDRIYTASKKDKLNEVEECNNLLLDNVFKILPSCIPSIAEAEIACYITTNSIKVIRYSIETIHDFLTQPIFLQILQQVFGLLSIESTNDPIINIKVQIYKLVTFLNSAFLPKKLKVKSDQRKQFAAFYRTEVVPLIIESTSRLLQTPMTFQLKRWVMDAFYQFIFFETYNDNIFTPDFLTCVLLKNARIDEEDVNDPEINPTIYANVMMDMDLLNDKEYTARAFGAMIIEQAVRKLHLVEPLYQFFFSNSEDIFDFEAKIFLLIKYLKTMISIEKERRRSLKKKNQKRLGPIVPPIRNEDMHSIIGKLQEGVPPFLQITLISVCILFFKYNDPKQGIQMSHQIIIGSELPIIAYYGAKMFNSCMKQLENNSISDAEKNELFAGFEVLKVIEKLFAVTKIFNDRIASSMIATLCKTDINILSSSGVELIHILYELVYDHCVNNETDKEAQAPKEILENIFNIIVEFDDDAPILFQAMNESFTFANKVLAEISDIFDAYEELFEILGLINQKITSTQQIQIDMLQVLMPFWIRFKEISLHSSRQICQFIYPMITSKENPFSQNQEMMETIVHFAEFMLIQANEEINYNLQKRLFKNNDPSYSMGYSLLLASCIIQVWGNVNTSFLQMAISMITPQRIENINQEYYYFTIMGSLYVLAAYFVVDPQTAISALNQDLIVAITSIIGPENITKYREMVIGMILLCNFTRMGYNQAYLTAAKCYKYLIKYRPKPETENNEDQNDEEVNEEEEEEEEADDDDDIPTFYAQYDVPFDKYNAVELFREVSEQTGLFSQLDPNLQNEIQSLS